jgi:hypothetical protein
MIRLRACCVTQQPSGFEVAAMYSDPSRRERDEEKHVDPLQECGLDCEEVAGKHPCGLRTKERAPRRLASHRQRRKAVFEQHLPHRGRRDDDAQALEFADDTPVSPVRVLMAEAQNQSTQRRFERPAGSPVRIGPAAGNQLTVRAQQRLGLDREAGPGGSRQ